MLTSKEFAVLAKQAGFDPADPHLDDLFPDVQLLLGRGALLFEDDLSRFEPSSAHPPTAPGTPDAGA
jgi:hypothetical protein